MDAAGRAPGCELTDGEAGSEAPAGERGRRETGMPDPRDEKRHERAGSRHVAFLRWGGQVSCSWLDAGNWSPHGVPVADSDVHFGKEWIAGADAGEAR